MSTSHRSKCTVYLSFWYLIHLRVAGAGADYGGRQSTPWSGQQVTAESNAHSHVRTIY